MARSRNRATLAAAGYAILRPKSQQEQKGHLDSPRHSSLGPTIKMEQRPPIRRRRPSPLGIDPEVRRRDAPPRQV
jgi:hypothetical protein